MKTGWFLCVLLLGGWIGPAAADVGPDVELHWPGKALTTTDARDAVVRIALRVLESSNFHSAPDDAYHIFHPGEVQAQYRKEVSGRYLLVSFPAAQWVKTVGGEILVSQIVIGLNRDDYASNLFTIDDSGRVVGHSKFSGVVCIELFDAIRRLAQQP